MPGSDFRTCEASNTMMFQLTVCIDAVKKSICYSKQKSEIYVLLVLPWASILFPHIRFWSATS